MFNTMAATSTSQFGSDQGMQAKLNANMIFSNVMNRGKWVMFLQKLIGKQNKLQALSQIEEGKKPSKNKVKKIEVISLAKIVGSEDRVCDFEKHFRPLVNHTRDRWVGIAIAHYRGIPLPPVELIQVEDKCYVRDDHHRISVAKTFDQASIEAQILYKLA
jgi:hypothetical protein